MHLKTSISAIVLSLLLPATVLAAAPGLPTVDGGAAKVGTVTGIKTSVDNGKVVVSWDAATGDHIATYNVYWSHASILKANGQYDDFASVDGTKTSLTLDHVPPVQMLYVSVMAVNDKNEESPYFAEEAMVDVSGMTNESVSSDESSSIAITSSTSFESSVSSESSVKTGEPQSLKLLSAEAVSATGILLTFSDTVAVDSAKAVDAFSIQTGSGKQLALTRIVINGKTILLNTLPQTRGAVYVVRIGDGVTGKDALGNAFAMDAIQAPMLFTGHASGLEPQASSSSTASAEAENLTDLKSLTLLHASEGKGFYSVTANWRITDSDTIVGYSVSQSTDGGRIWSNPALISKTVKTVKIPHIPAGTFSLLVHVRFADGSTSRGLMESVILKGVPQGHGTSGHLPNSGTGTVIAFLLASALLGYRIISKRQRVEA